MTEADDLSGIVLQGSEQQIAAALAKWGAALNQ